MGPPDTPLRNHRVLPLASATSGPTGPDRARPSRPAMIVPGEPTGVGRAPAIEPGRPVTEMRATDVPSEDCRANMLPSGDHGLCNREEPRGWDGDRSTARSGRARRLVEERSSSVVFWSLPMIRTAAPAASTSSCGPADEEIAQLRVTPPKSWICAVAPTMATLPVVVKQ